MIQANAELEQDKTPWRNCVWPGPNTRLYTQLHPTAGRRLPLRSFRPHCSRSSPRRKILKAAIAGGRATSAERSHPAVQVTPVYSGKPDNRAWMPPSIFRGQMALLVVEKSLQNGSGFIWPLFRKEVPRLYRLPLNIVRPEAPQRKRTAHLRVPFGKRSCCAP